MKKIGRYWIPQDDLLFTKYCINKEDTLYGHNFQTKYITKIIKESNTSGNVIDAGANIGLFATAFSQHFNKVFAFEPVPMNNECLISNTKGYDNIQLFDCALGSKQETVEMIGRLNNTGTFRIVEDPNGRKGNAVYSKISVKPLDEFNLENVSCIKIDCEGYEADILEGAEKTISATKPLLCIEFMPVDKGGDLDTHTRTNKLLNKYGYKKIWTAHADSIYKAV